MGEITVLSVRVSTEDLTKVSREKRTSEGRFQVPRENEHFQGHPPLNRGMASSRESCKTGRVELGGGNERRLRC